MNYKILFVSNLNHTLIIQNPTTSNGMTSKKKNQRSTIIDVQKVFRKRNQKELSDYCQYPFYLIVLVIKYQENTIR